MKIKKLIGLLIIGLIIFFPLILIITILSWVDTRSPFFYQKRVGINKKVFLFIIILILLPILDEIQFLF
mgnify:CR=1 FL=1